MTDKLFDMLTGSGINCARNFPLSHRSSFRVGGVGEIGIFPKDIGELTECLSAVRQCGIKYHVIGNGSNILFLDGELSGAFIFTEGARNICVSGSYIYAEAGASLSAVATAAAECSLGGLEFAKGIPGSVGGAMFMNAGAYGGQMSDAVISTIAYDTENGEMLKITEHGFSYRDSIYMRSPSLICLSAELRLTEGDKDEIFEKMRDFAKRRKENQPLEYPSAGSYFKRPEGHFAGKLIEDCGLKGLRVGGAEISEKHAGFIINTGDATASDILELEKRVCDAVYEKFGVTLEREVRVIG